LCFVVFAAYLVAKRSQKQGYPFQRTFIMSIIGFTAIGLLVINLISWLLF